MLKTTLSENSINSFTEKLGSKEYLTFDEFVDWALYDRTLGYYRKEKLRVGRIPNTDFYTASCFSDLWAELITEACTNLIYPKPSSSFHFIEIGAEPNESLLHKKDHPFSSFSVVRKDDLFEIPPMSIVYSNEWLDAQPFRRFSFSRNEKQWLEHGVSLQDDILTEFKLESSNSDQSLIPEGNFNELSDGYIIDLPTGANKSLVKLLEASSGTGLFIAFDYGINTEELFLNRPDGTARAYKNHQMVKNFLCHPGDQDITCHICWDQLIEILRRHGFHNTKLDSQESFFMKYAGNLLRKIITGGNKAKVNAIKELIHPHFMGHKFQSLHAFRDPKNKIQGSLGPSKFGIS